MVKPPVKLAERKDSLGFAIRPERILIHSAWSNTNDFTRHAISLALIERNRFAYQASFAAAVLLVLMRLSGSRAGIGSGDGKL